ncbi:MAG: recombination mediator RecR [Candidatus Izemoplasmatales bacterium]
MGYPKALEALIEEFMNYPGIGRKTAERYALYTINEIEQETTVRFSEALLRAKELIKPCKTCHHLTDQDECEICTNKLRDHSKIMVVETSKDVFSIEKSGMYQGRYHVLNGAISPINGVGPNDINLLSLWSRVENDEVKEIIIATSATQEGETTAMYIKRVLEKTDLLVTRIGYGVPVGTNLEYADDQTLLKAIENRRVF